MALRDLRSLLVKPALPGFADLQAQPLLPDPFLSLSTPEAPGARIASKTEWTCRRAEIAAQAQAYELGPKPPRPTNVSGSFSGSALTVTVDDGGPQIQFSVTLTPPATGEGPFPALIVLGGSTALDAPAGLTPTQVRNRQIPLAIVMVALTTLTLWSLGQAIVVTPPEAAQAGSLTLG